MAMFEVCATHPALVLPCLALIVELAVGGRRFKHWSGVRTACSRTTCLALFAPVLGSAVADVPVRRTVFCLQQGYLRSPGAPLGTPCAMHSAQREALHKQHQAGLICPHPKTHTAHASSGLVCAGIRQRQQPEHPVVVLPRWGYLATPITKACLRQLHRLGGGYPATPNNRNPNKQVRCW